MRGVPFFHVEMRQNGPLQGRSGVSLAALDASASKLAKKSSGSFSVPGGKAVDRARVRTAAHDAATVTLHDEVSCRGSDETAT